MRILLERSDEDDITEDESTNDENDDQETRKVHRNSQEY